MRIEVHAKQRILWYNQVMKSAVTLIPFSFLGRLSPQLHEEVYHHI